MPSLPNESNQHKQSYKHIQNSKTIKLDMCLLFEKKKNCKISIYFSLQIFLLVSLFLLCVSLSFQRTIQQFSIDNIMAFYSGKERVKEHSFYSNFLLFVCLPVLFIANFTFLFLMLSYMRAMWIGKRWNSVLKPWFNQLSMIARNSYEMVDDS